MSKYFGTDGFRGEAGITLTADHAYKVMKTACKPTFWYMVIENTYDGMLAPKEQQGFFTRKNNSEYHGIGLSSAMHLVEKHKGTLDVQPSAELFRVGIMIPIEK